MKNLFLVFGFTLRFAKNYNIKMLDIASKGNVCPPYQIINMISGIIQVGKATNLEKIKATFLKLEKRALSNKGY